jgi:uncharacterized membrane protein
MADQDDEMVLRVARMEAFSDGVFAIAITLLVLEIAIPSGFEGHLLRGVLSQWPSYLAYIVSFATIGAIWLGHNTITHYMHSANTTFLRLNLALLLLVSFLPFPTKLLAENLGSRDDEKVAATIYGVALLGAMSLLSVVVAAGCTREPRTSRYRRRGDQAADSSAQAEPCRLHRVDHRWIVHATDCDDWLSGGRLLPDLSA